MRAAPSGARLSLGAPGGVPNRPGARLRLPTCWLSPAGLIGGSMADAHLHQSLRVQFKTIRSHMTK